MSWKGISIRIKLIVICLALAIAPVSIAGIIIYNNVSDGVYGEIEDKLDSQVEAYKCLVASCFEQIENQKKAEVEQAKVMVESQAGVVYELIDSGKENPEELKNRIASIKVGQTGYVYVLDYEGNYIVSQDRQRDGENIWNAQDAGGGYFIQSIIRKGKTLRGNQIASEIYSWQNVGEKQARDKIVGIIHCPELKWVIGIGSYFDEFVDTGFENKILAELKQKIKNVKVGKTGYMYVINSNGVLQIHPDKEGQSLSQYEFIQEIIRTKEGYIQYPWEGREKVVSFAYYEPKDWIVASGSYLSDFEGTVTNTRNIILLVCVVGIVAAALIAYWFAGGIANPLQKVVRLAQGIAQGDLSSEALKIKSKDEIGQLGNALNEMSTNLNDMVSQVASATSQIASSTQELSATSEEMAAGAEEQTSQTSQVATSVEEMSATVQEVAKNAKNASDSSGEAGKTAEEGGEIVSQTVGEMEKIAKSVSDLQGVIQGLNKNSEKIGDIVGVIDDVADQTNLLALNAAIEAARAGEQGRGFAVVADEVRKLAERTTSSTKEIADMVKSIQGDTSQAVSSMEEAGKEVKEGVEVADKSGDALKKIVEMSQGVNQIVQQIATAAEQQAAASEEISSNVESIASVSKQSASGAQQTSSAAQELSSLTDNLQSLVNQFKLRNGGKVEAKAERASIKKEKVGPVEQVKVAKPKKKKAA